MLFGGLNKDVPIPIIIENAGVGKLVLVLLSRSFRILLDQLFVWEFLLWVFIEKLHVGVLEYLSALKRGGKVVMPIPSVMMVSSATIW